MSALFEWRPNPGPQYAFLASGAFEALYGGAAGGGKSEALVLAALRHIDKPHYWALLLRRTFPELESSLVARSRLYYPLVDPGASYNEAKKTWTFSSGAKIQFGHCEHEKDVLHYQGAEFQFLGFDELTHFTHHQYTYLLSRLRSSQGLPVRVRAATNPGGPGAEWVFARWAPWLDRRPEYRGLRAAPAESLWYRNTENGEEYGPKGPDAFARVFIPAKLSDNPKLNADYAERLKGLDPVTRAQLLDGDWLARPAAGAYFKRAWLPLVDVLPAQVRRCRYWDRAASKEGDWTVGARVSRDAAGVFYVEDVVRLRGTPHEVSATIKRTTELDGKACPVVLEQDPGQAGVVEVSHYVRELAGYTVQIVRPTGSKIVRAGPASSQAQAGNLRIKRAPWAELFIRELEAFPDDKHDDQVDALSGAVSYLAQPRGRSEREVDGL